MLPTSVKIGSRANFTCFSPDGQPAERIEWQNSTGDTQISAANTNSLMLLFDPVAPSDNNTEYCCIMTNGIAITVTIQTQRKLIRHRNDLALELW